MGLHHSFNAVLTQALADPATILLIRLASESGGRIVCELVSPHGFSVSTNTDGDMTACPIDAHCLTKNLCLLTF